MEINQYNFSREHERGFEILYLAVKMVGLCVVKTVEESPVGQQTPGINNRLKHNESRKSPKFNSSSGQTLKSSQRPGRPCGVIHRFSPSLPSTSSGLAVKGNRKKCPHYGHSKCSIF